MNGKKGVGYVSQSGAFGVLTYMAAAQNGISFNYFVSTGNEMESNFEDFIEYMVHDPETNIISGYLEGAKDPEKLKMTSKEGIKSKQANFNDESWPKYCRKSCSGISYWFTCWFR